MTVLAAQRWPTNAHLIEDVARLGYITDDDLVLDMTYGRGGFWTRYRPPRLVTVDINTPAHLRADNRRLPVRDRAFDVAVFDPPYKLNGTPALGDFDARYGIEEVTRWQDRMDRIDGGLIAAWRALAIGGRLLVKCQDQVCSGQVRWQTDHITHVARVLGMVKVDRFDLLGTHRPQPPGRTQKHAHGRPSTLLIFVRKAKVTDTETSPHDTPSPASPRLALSGGGDPSPLAPSPTGGEGEDQGLRRPPLAPEKGATPRATP